MNPIIVGLDTKTAAEAIGLAEQVRPHVGGFKVGLGLLHGPGPGIVGALARLGPVFADAKLHDIPTQVERAARRLGEFGARWVTAHASGGTEMLEAAHRGLSSSGGGVLAVTVLTSLDAGALAGVGIDRTPGKLVSRMARAAEAVGVEGVVCSPQELGVVAEVAPNLVRVTPGIRPEGWESGDQRRTATPREAIERGADLLVIARPIITASDPAAAAAEIAASLDR